jgi:hypothetical protein
VNPTIDAGVVPVDPDDSEGPDNPDRPDLVQPQDPNQPFEMPLTGSDSVMSMLSVALRLLVVGAGLMIVERRRRSSLGGR